MKQKLFNITDFKELDELRVRLDKFIDSSYFYYWNNDEQVSEQCRTVIKDFEKVAKDISKTHNVDINLIRAYFTMDKYIYPRVAKFLKKENTCKNVGVVIEGFEDKPLTNSAYLKAYSSKNTSFIEKLEEHRELLPEYSQKYINNKMNEAPADAKITKISNEFQLRAVENLFTKSPTYITANKLFRTFLNCDTYHDKFNSLFGLFKILSENSHLVKDDIGKFNELKLEVARKSKHPLEQCLGYNWRSDFSSVAKFAKKLYCDEYVVTMIDRFPKTNVYFLLNFAKSDKAITKFEKRISSIISNNDETFGMDFHRIDKDLQKLIVKENIRQFFTHKKANWALWEESK